MRRWAIAVAVLAAAAIAWWRWRAPSATKTVSSTDTRATQAERRDEPAPPRVEIGPAAGGRDANAIAEGRRRHDELRRELRAGETRRAAPAPSGAGSNAAPAELPLDESYLRGRMQEMLPLLKECYDLARAKRPDLAGRLKLRFDIVGAPGLGGIVERAEVVHRPAPDGGAAEELADATLEEWVQASVESLTFPPPSSNGRVTVSYPFVFATDGPHP